MTTKEQERAALAKIEKILAPLGEDSYLATAFRGCLADAAANIDDDAAYSMADRYEREVQKRTELENELHLRDDTIEALKLRFDRTEKRLLSHDDLCDLAQLASNHCYELDEKIRAAESEIVRLADDPTDPAFAETVRLHRVYAKDRDYFCELQHRVAAACNAGR